MRRLTDQIYLQNRRQLVELWNLPAATPTFLLPAADQWALHVYYLMSQKVSERVLLEHRHDISQLDPSLPQRGGRALSRLRVKQQKLAALPPIPKKRKGADYVVRVFGEVHPELDPARFAKILTDAAREQERKDRGL